MKSFIKPQFDISWKEYWFNIIVESISAIFMAVPAFFFMLVVFGMVSSLLFDLFPSASFEVYRYGLCELK